MEMLVNEKEISVSVEYFDKKKNDLYGNGYTETDLVYDYIVDNNIQFDNEKYCYVLSKKQYEDMFDFLLGEVRGYNIGYSEYLGENKGDEAELIIQCDNIVVGWQC